MDIGKLKHRRLFITIGIIVLIYLLFLIYNNINLTPKREYVYYKEFKINNYSLNYDCEIIKGAEPIFINKKSKEVVLLLHGLGGTPVELKELAYYLEENNFSVVVPLLKYQGRRYEDIKQLDGDEIYNEISEIVDVLKQDYKEVYVGGLSSGGLLSLKLAEEKDLDGVISLAAPMTFGANFLGDSTVYFFKISKYLTPSFRRIKYGLARNMSIDKILPSFDRLPVKALLEDEFLKKEVKNNLIKISEPILIVQSDWDNRAAPSSANYIYSHVSSSNKEILWLNNSGHVITMDYDKQIVFVRITEFIKNN